MVVSRFTGLILITMALAAAISTAKLPLLGRDFIQFWTSGQAIRQGFSPYDQEFQARTQQANGWDVKREPIPFQPYFYPPWVAIAVIPLSLIPYRIALNLWMAFSLVAAALAIGIMLRLGSRSTTGIWLLIVMLFGFTFLPMLHGLAVGQLSAALLAILAGMIWGLETRRERWAGVCLGLLSIKPHVGLIIALVVGIALMTQRRWRPLLWASATVWVCISVSFLVSPAWVGDMLAAPHNFTALTGWSFPLNGYQDNPTAYAALRVSAELGPIALGFVVAGLIGLATAAVWRARRGVSASMQWASAAGCVSAFLLTPYARSYDLTLLLWPLIYFVFSDELVVPTWLRYGLGLLLYLTPVVLLLLAGQGVGNVIAVYILAMALFMLPGHRGSEKSRTR